MRTIAAEIRTAFDRTPPQHNDTLPACRAGRSDGRGVRLERPVPLAPASARSQRGRRVWNGRSPPAGGQQTGATGSPTLLRHGSPDGRPATLTFS